MGYDDIRSLLIKNISKNWSFVDGIFPSELRLAKIITVLKTL